MKLHLLAALTLLASTLAAAQLAATTYTVDSLSALQSRINSAKPGDVITVKNGAYTANADIAISCAGKDKQPVTITAETVGGVEIGGAHGFVVKDASYVVISGFKFTHAAKHQTIDASSNHIRYMRNTFTCPGNGYSLGVRGDDCEVDHNEFSDRIRQGNMIDVAGAGKQVARNLWIHHNYFHDIRPSKVAKEGNGLEVIRFGLSGLSMSKGNGIVEYNLFVRCSGENETISNKSCANTYRYNTFLDAPGGELSVRHGNDCLVYANYFRNTHGIRICGDRHKIFSNYLEKNRIGIATANGDGLVGDIGGPDKLTSHDRPDDVIIASNILIGNGTSYTMGGRPNGLGATNITFANNIIIDGGEAVDINGPYPGAVWHNNIIWGAATTAKLPANAAAGFKKTDPKLAPNAKGILVPAAGSPMLANDKIPGVTLPDVDTTIHPLTPADVGPSAK